MTQYSAVRLLSSEHDTRVFDCGSEAQTNWLRRHALNAQRAESCRVYVACHVGENRVAGYYALAAGSVESSEAPERIRKGIGQYPVPVVILARLGVALGDQGQGLGKALVRDALLRAASAADTIGIRALLIHCESQHARAFYEHIADFEPSPTDPLHLLLLMKDLRATIQAGR